ncbi:hypothetical protein ACTFRK_11210 [Bacillus cereus group sp. MYBK227-2]|uniref:hypothetical protein n=1 Tax=Bacillus cereus group TaxID=86661 RepID=UPI000BF4E4A8|nr:hypothetical protein [Bacillus cereus]PFM73575.1 hypothetical protein COJ54_25130 [Bacillus cereus]
MQKNKNIKQLNMKQLNKIFKKNLLQALVTPTPTLLQEIFNELHESEVSIDSKIEKVNASLKETSQIIKELEIELTERAQRLDLLQIEYERYSKLAAIEQEKASALLSQVDHSVNKGKRSERWAGFWISTLSGLFIFILGLILSPILTPWITNLLGISQK